MAEVYEMMMKLGLSGTAMADLTGVAQALGRMHTTVGSIGKGFEHWGIALGAVGSIIGGAMILGALERVVKEAKSFSDELIKIKGLGGPMAESVVSGGYQKEIFNLSNKVPLKVDDLSKLYGALYSVFGKEEAGQLMEPMAKFSWAQQFKKDFKGDAGKDMQDFIRSGELTGRFVDPETNKIDVETTKRFLDLSNKVMAATHGMVTPQTLLGMSKQGGFTMRHLSDEGFMSMAILAQAMGGPRAGTAYMSMMQQMGSGTMRKRTALGMEELGLLKPEEWSTDKGGGVIIKDEASKRLSKLMSHDPLDMIANLEEEFKKQGITDPEERARRVMRAFGRQTTQRMSGEEMTNYRQMLAERERMKGASSVEDLVKSISEGSITANLAALHNAWHNLNVAVAGPNSENVISVLKYLTDTINSLKQTVREMDPEIVKKIGITVAAVAAFMVGGGAATLLALLGPAGVIVGIVAGGAVIAATMIDWKKVEAEWATLLKVLQSHDVFDAVVKGLNSVMDSIKSFGAWLGSFSPFSKASAAPAIGSSGKDAFPEWMGRPSGPTGISPIPATPFKKSAFLGDNDVDNASIIPANFNPSTNRQINFRHETTMNVDGRTLAQVISDVLEDLYEHPTGSPSPDGLGQFRPQGNFSST